LDVRSGYTPREKLLFFVKLRNNLTLPQGGPLQEGFVPFTRLARLLAFVVLVDTESTKAPVAPSWTSSIFLESGHYQKSGRDHGQHMFPRDFVPVLCQSENGSVVVQERKCIAVAGSAYGTCWSKQ